MDHDRYLPLIKKELQHLPDYVRDFYLQTNHSVTTIYQYLTEFRRFFNWLREAGITDATENAAVAVETLAKLRRTDIMLYIDYLKHSTNRQGRPNSPTSINRSINALRSLFKFLTVTADTVDGKPYFTQNVMLKVDSLNATETLNYRAHNLETHMYTGERKYEFIEYMQNQYEKDCDPRAKAAFKKNKERDICIAALILGTGVRVSEAANINVADLHLTDSMLDVIRKGGMRDAVPIAPWVMPYIQDYVAIRKNRYNPPKDQHAFFLTQYHGTVRRITYNSIEKLIKKYSTAFGHPLTPHKLRHTLASELYGITKDQVLVSQQLGQKGTSATDLYTHVNQEAQKDALKQLK